MLFCMYTKSRGKHMQWELIEVLAMQETFEEHMIKMDQPDRPQ